MTTIGRYVANARRVWRGGRLAPARTFAIAGASALAMGASAIAQSAPDPVLPLGADQQRWSVSETIVGHRNMHRLFPVAWISASAKPYPLPRGRTIAPTYVFDGAERDVADYMSRGNVTGLLVLKNGRIVLEKYKDGNDENTMWTTRSVAKSLTSTVIGMAVKDGAIRSIDDPAGRYVPELAATAYGKVPVRHLLQMGSGVGYSERVDSAKVQGCTIERRAGCFLDVVRGFGDRDPATAKPSGTVFNYSSADAEVDALIATRATGTNLAAYLERKLWHPFGMEHAAYWTLDGPDGVVMGPSGFGATLRDWGRIGLFMMRGGQLADGTKRLPDWWMAQATQPSAASISHGQAYGFNWWLRPTIDAGLGAPRPETIIAGDTMFVARGSGGQIIAVNPAEQVVVVKWSAWARPPEQPSGDRATNEDTVFMAATIAALHRRNK